MKVSHLHSNHSASRRKPKVGQSRYLDRPRVVDGRAAGVLRIVQSLFVCRRRNSVTVAM